MTTITQDQAFQRWDTIPLVLREALCSESNSDFLWKTCEAEHLPEEKIYHVARIAGYVFLGFLHPEDLADELSIQLDLSSKITKPIADAINARLFDPLRNDIDKIYNPLSKLKSNPKIIQDIGPISNVAPAAQLSGMPPPTPPVPQPGWSRVTSSEPVVKLDRTAMPGAALKPEPPAKPPVAPPVAKPAPPPPAGTMDEFERLARQHGEVPHTQTPQKETPHSGPQHEGTQPDEKKVAEPPPVMIHKDTEFTAQPQAPGFRLELPSKPINMHGAPTPPPAKSAVLEFGAKPPKPPKPAGPATTRVVHYTDYKSPSPEHPVTPATPPAAPQGPRQVTEITSADFKPEDLVRQQPPEPPKPPAVHPMPPAPPRTPASLVPPPITKPLAPPPLHKLEETPPSAQNLPLGKVVHKDYMEESVPKPPTPPSAHEPPLPPKPPAPPSPQR